MSGIRPLLPLLLVLSLGLPARDRRAAEVRPLQRGILAFYNSREETDVFDTKIHRAAEMPLNYLGCVVEYRDINQPLPPPEAMEGIRGILTWFQTDDMPDPKGFLDWAGAAVLHGKKFVMLGDSGVSRDYQNRPTPPNQVNRFLALLGVEDLGEWTRLTYDCRFVFKDPKMMDFERPMSGVLPPFDHIRKTDPDAKSFLIVRRRNDPETDSHLAVVNAHGGFCAAGYAMYSGEGAHRKQLYLNLFEFFRLAFATDGLPKPDVTTLAGRRVFYSHIDGDGWRNQTEVPGYRESGEISARVILDRVLRAYPDIPTTVAPIVGDLDPAWYGDARCLELAKEMFRLSHIEAGSHTYSHPLNWNFFVRGTFEQEKALAAQTDHNGGSYTMRGHDVPRSYVLKPFSLGQEIAGSAAFINSLLPPGKRVEVLQWSGDTLPFEAAVAAAREAGLRNLNGGDTRLDTEYPSYVYVSPIGRQVGKERQIYAANSNENTYTELFTDRYFGFRDLIETHRNTESPRRVKPMSLYYHMFSGQKPASLKALLDNLDRIRRQEIIPIRTSHYAAIADGFYSVRLVPLGGLSWRIEGRGELQTIRFDPAGAVAVDFQRSSGVIGQRLHQGSLYVALDPSVASPVVSLKSGPDVGSSSSSSPYLVHSRWNVWGLQRTKQGISFQARGFGPGEMAWQMTAPGRYGLTVALPSAAPVSKEVRTDRNGMLMLSLPAASNETATVTVILLEGGA